MVTISILSPWSAQYVPIAVKVVPALIAIIQSAKPLIIIAWFDTAQC